MAPKGKRLEDLQIDASPILHHFEEPADPRGTEWYRFAQEIDDLLASGAYTWAEDTLNDIAESVRTRRWVTDGQRRAVRNIEGAKGRPTGGFARRYEGWRG